MLKTSIASNLESRVINYNKIINRLHLVHCCPVEELLQSENLNISKSTLKKYVEDLNKLLGEELFLIKDRIYFFPKKTLKENEQLIYRTSAFLNLLSYCVSPSKKSFSDYIQSNYLSKASAYQLKKKATIFLQEFDCADLKSNTIQTILKKMLLIARLELDYGLTVLSAKKKSQYNHIIQGFINSLPKSIIFGERKELFHHLIFQALTLKFDIQEKNYFDYLFSYNATQGKIYRMFKSFVRKHSNYAINEKTNICFFYFAFLTNSPQTKYFFNQDKINILIKEFELTMQCSLNKNLLFYYALTDVYKYLNFPGYFQLMIDYEEKRTCNSYLLKNVIRIFTKAKLKVPLSMDMLRFFCYKLEEIELLRKHPKIYIFSHSYREYLSIFYYLKTFCKLNIVVVDVWFYDLEQLKFCQCDNSFVITNRKNIDTFIGWENIYFIELPLTEKELNSLHQSLLGHIL